MGRWIEVIADAQTEIATLTARCELAESQLSAMNLAPTAAAILKENARLTARVAELETMVSAIKVAAATHYDGDYLVLYIRQMRSRLNLTQVHAGGTTAGNVMNDYVHICYVANCANPAKVRGAGGVYCDTHWQQKSDRASVEKDAARWRKLVADTDAVPCKYPCLRDDLGDWLSHADGAQL